MKKLVLILILVLPFFAKAQQALPLCGHSRFQEELMRDPVYKAQYEATKEFLKTKNLENYKTVNGSGGTEYHIPVVVHVIHTGGAVGSNYNPTDAAIQAFISHINEGFSNTNDVAAVPGTFNSVATPLRFYLAQRDELANCSATTGINRIDLSSNATYVASGVGSPGITDATLKSVIHWNDLDYYNVYIVNKIDGENGYTTSGSYTAGYAYYPVIGGNSLDGMVVLAQQVNFTNSVFIHEMGHSFNLIHPFEGGDASNCPANANCLSDNDEVCDTDPIRLTFACNPTTGNNPCTGSPWTSSTIQFNYMAYNGCTDRFTAGQVVRVNDVISNIRTAYRNSAGVDAPPSALPTSITPCTFNAANAGNNFNMGPVYVGLNAIEYNSKGYSFEGAGDIHYVDHTCNQSTTLIQGAVYPVSVKTSLNAQKVRIYIDYDNNGVFTNAAPELVFSNNGGSGNVTHSGNITVPTTGIVYDTPLRMRVIADNAATITPTMQLNAGQAEDYTVIVAQAPLPVSWRSFQAQLIASNQVALTWVTELEVNNDYFEVQKSTDGIEYTTLTKVNGFKEKYSPTHYSYLDKAPMEGVNYYRIKQVDIDGKYSFSKTELINLASPQFSSYCFPNPITDNLKLGYYIPKDGKIRVSILDVNGKEVWNQIIEATKGSAQVELQAAHLRSGFYIIKVQTASQIQTHRILKQ